MAQRPAGKGSWGRGPPDLAGKAGGSPSQPSGPPTATAEAFPSLHSAVGGAAPAPTGQPLNRVSPDPSRDDLAPDEPVPKVKEPTLPPRAASAARFDYYVVLDFEATCDRDTKLNLQEIIEFPSVLVDAHKATVVSEFQRYVRPTHNPQLSKFCTDLTGIQQATVDAAEPFDAVMRQYLHWLREGDMGVRPPQKSFAFVTCGDWDLKTMLPHQLSHSPYPLHPDDVLAFSQFVNIKKVFTAETGRRPGGMPDMLNHYKRPLMGRHHSGIDDCRNIATILLCMLRQGVDVDFTTTPKKSAYTHFTCVSQAPPPPKDLVDVKRVRGPEPAAAPESDPVEDLLAAHTGPFLPDAARETLSRGLTKILRHKAKDMGLPMEKDGYVELDALLQLNRFKSLHAQYGDVARAVKENDKQRLRLAYRPNGKVYIRANQGHSMEDVEVDMVPVTSAEELPVCVHGTTSDAWRSIATTGLNKMKRQHIHFAVGLPGATGVISGMRKSCAVLVYLDVAALLRDRIPLLRSANNVILSPGIGGIIPPKYFAKVVDQRTNTVLFPAPAPAPAPAP